MTFLGMSSAQFYQTPTTTSMRKDGQPPASTHIETSKPARPSLNPSNLIMNPIFDRAIDGSIHQISKAIRTVRRLFASRESSELTIIGYDVSSSDRSNNVTTFDQEPEPANYSRYTYEISGQPDPVAAAEYHRDRLQSKGIEMEYGSALQREVERAGCHHTSLFVGNYMLGM